jgi:hypothetical protein
MLTMHARRYHAETVALFESMDEADKANPDSWAYAHAIMSHMRDAMGVARWPRDEKAMRERLKHHFQLCGARSLVPAAAAAAACAHQEMPLELTPNHREQEGIAADAAAAAAAAEAEAGATAPAAQPEDAQPEDAAAKEEGYDSLVSDSESDEDEARRVSSLRGEAARLGGLAQQARQRQLPKWVPRAEFSRLRFKVLAEYCNIASWHRCRCCFLCSISEMSCPGGSTVCAVHRALELHAEMKGKGLELPAAEMLEIIEVCRPLLFLQVPP